MLLRSNRDACEGLGARAGSEVPVPFQWCPELLIESEIPKKIYRHIILVLSLWMQYVASVTASSKVALLLENYTPDVDHLHLACYPLLSIPRDLDKRVSSQD